MDFSFKFKCMYIFVSIVRVFVSVYLKFSLEINNVGEVHNDSLIGGSG